MLWLAAGPGLALGGWSGPRQAAVGSFFVSDAWVPRRYSRAVIHVPTTRCACRTKHPDPSSESGIPTACFVPCRFLCFICFFLTFRWDYPSFLKITFLVYNIIHMTMWEPMQNSNFPSSFFKTVPFHLFNRKLSLTVDRQSRHCFDNFFFRWDVVKLENIPEKKNFLQL